MPFFLSSPLALLALLPAFYLLIQAYRKRRFGPTVPVASNFILSQLELRTKRTRFVPPLRFFLELLLLLLLALGAAGLQVDEQNRDKLFLLDNSLSMSALAPESGRSYLELAKERLELVTDEVSVTDRARIFVSSPTLREIESGSQLEELLPAYARDSLRTAVGNLQSRFPQSPLTVFSDKFANIDKDPFTELKTVRSSDLKLPNIAIREALFRSSSESNTLSLELESFAEREERVELEVLELIESSNSARFSSVKRVSLSLPAAERKEFQIEGLSGEAYALKLAPSQQNRLAADDVAYVLRGEESAAIQIVSPLPRKSLGLKKLSGFELEVLSPSEYERAEKTERLRIFHRYVPRELAPGHTIYLAPSRATFPGVRSATQEAVTITSWEQNDSLLRYLKLAGLELKTAGVFELDASTESLLQSDKGALAFRFREGSFQQVVIGLELLPFLGSESVTSSLFMLNSLSWLESLPPVKPSLENSGELAPEFFQLELESSAFELSPALLRYEGRGYEVRKFFDETESDSLKSKSVVLSSRKLSGVSSAPSEQGVVDGLPELLRYIALFVLGLILLEALLLAFAPRRRVA